MYKNILDLYRNNLLHELIEFIPDLYTKRLRSFGSRCTTLVLSESPGSTSHNLFSEMSQAREKAQSEIPISAIPPSVVNACKCGILLVTDDIGNCQNSNKHH